MSGSNGLPENSDYTERYARHLVLKEIGGAGQQKLSAARVLVIGAGGLGASLLAYLAAAGVGRRCHGRPRGRTRRCTPACSPP